MSVATSQASPRTHTVDGSEGSAARGVTLYTLQPREQSSSRRFMQTHQLLWLAEGKAILQGELGQNQVTFEAPALVWIGQSRGQRIKLRSHSQGALLGLDHRLLMPLVGQQAELTPLMQSDGVVQATRLPAQLIERLPILMRWIDEADLSEGLSSIAQLHITLLLLEFCQHANVQATRDEDGVPLDSVKVVEQFQRLVEQHFAERWSVAYYADAIGVSVDRLYTNCRRELGLSPQRYMHRRLLSAARDRLASSRASMDHIALNLGFRDSAQFSHFFKKHQGVAPTQYRTEHRKAPEGFGF